MDDKKLMDLVSVISFLIVLIFLFFAFFLLTVKTKNKTRNGLLASFLIITAIDISSFFYYKYIILPLPVEMLRAICFSFFKSPLLYLYVLSLIYTDFRLKPKHLVHAIPFLLSILVLFPGFFMADRHAQQYFLGHFHEMKAIKFLDAAIHLQSFAYIIANIVVLRKYKVLLLENYASNISLSNYKWLYQLTVVMIILGVITQIKDFLKLTEYIDIANSLTVLMLVGGLMFTFWIVLNALYYPDLFRGIDARLQPVEKLIVEVAADGTPDIENNERIRELRDYMVQEEPYLESALTIQDLAKQMKMPARDLSVLINHTLNQHFFDFINEYRIEKAMQILADPKENKLTILEVLYKVGFNSKSSFHTAFKKHTDLTPTQYRKTYSL